MYPTFWGIGSGYNKHRCIGGGRGIWTEAALFLLFFQNNIISVQIRRGTALPLSTAQQGTGYMLQRPIAQIIPIATDDRNENCNMDNQMRHYFLRRLSGRQPVRDLMDPTRFPAPTVTFMCDVWHVS